MARPMSWAASLMLGVLVAGCTSTPKPPPQRYGDSWYAVGGTISPGVYQPVRGVGFPNATTDDPSCEYTVSSTVGGQDYYAPDPPPNARGPYGTHGYVSREGRGPNLVRLPPPAPGQSYVVAFGAMSTVPPFPPASQDGCRWERTGDL
jgi:hypothetical protein